jgi:hypothetical protein
MAATGQTRRAFLRAAGVGLALPLLDSPGPFAGPASRAAPEAAAPRRLIAVCAGLGLCPEYLFPANSGRDYALTPYLSVLKDYRACLTVCSGLSHPDVGGGHEAEVCFLTAAPRPGQPGFRNSISLDQLAVEKLKPDTRFASLALSTYSSSVSFNAAGVQIPPDSSPSALFARLFLQGNRDEVRRQVNRLKDRRSILDAVRGQARQFARQVGTKDRERLDQYFTAVREVEQGLLRAQEWSKRPRPKVSVPPPRDIAGSADVVGRTRLMLDLAHLAFQTDSTRLVTLKIDVVGVVPPVPGVKLDHHNLSHHGKDPEKLRQLRLIETQQVTALRDFLGKLRQSKEGGGTLLDRTMVLYGSNLGNASSHDTKNLPILLAGGGFRHGRHLAFDRRNNTPLGKLYVSMLQRLGVETDRFASASGRLSGLDPT